MNTRALPIYLLLVVLLCGASPDRVCSQVEETLPTPVEVWRDFDPEAGPLEEEVLRKWNEGGEHWQTVVLSVDSFTPGEGNAPLSSWKNLVVLWILPARGSAFDDPGWILTDFEWVDGKTVAGGAMRTLTAPEAQRTAAGDWVLLLRRE